VLELREGRCTMRRATDSRLMMPTLRAASLRICCAIRRNWRWRSSADTRCGHDRGVDVATASSQRAFDFPCRRSTVPPPPDHGGPRGIDEQLYAQLRMHANAGAPTRFAPLVTGTSPW